MTVQQTIKRYRLYELLFWILFFAGWYFLRYQDFATHWMAIKITAIKVFDLAMLVYITNLFLIPKLLYRKKYVAFIAIYISMIFLSSVLKVTIIGNMLMPGGDFSIWNNFKTRLYDNIIPHFLLVSTGAAIKLLIDYARAQRRMGEMAKEKAEAELNFLRSQINPHFVFNTLNSIYFQISKENKEAREMLLRFSDILRYQLYDCNIDKIDIEKEMAYLKDYVELQKKRRDENYEVKWKNNNELGEKTATLSWLSAWIRPLIIALIALLAVIGILVYTNKKMRRTLSFSAALVALSFIACAQSEKEREQIGKDLNDNKTSTTAVLSNEKYMALHSLTAFREAIKRYAKPEPIKITTDKEPGVKITVRAKLLDRDGKPATNAIVYVYQTDDKGWYSDTAGHVQQNEGDRRHARLFGYMKSNSEGKFEFQTIRPVGYPKSDLPAHIHLEVTTAEGGGITTELLFDEDPRLSNTQTRQRAIQDGFIIAKGQKENNNLVYNYEVKMNR